MCRNDYKTDSQSYDNLEEIMILVLAILGLAAVGLSRLLEDVTELSSVSEKKEKQTISELAEEEDE